MSVKTKKRDVTGLIIGLTFMVVLAVAGSLVVFFVFVRNNDNTSTTVEIDVNSPIVETGVSSFTNTWTGDMGWRTILVQPRPSLEHGVDSLVFQDTSGNPQTLFIPRNHFSVMITDSTVFVATRGTGVYSPVYSTDLSFPSESQE